MRLKNLRQNLLEKIYLNFKWFSSCYLQKFIPEKILSRLKFQTYFIIKIFNCAALIIKWQWEKKKQWVEYIDYEFVKLILFKDSCTFEQVGSKKEVF